MFGYSAITTAHNIHQSNHFKMLLKRLTVYKMQIYYLKMWSFCIYTHTHTRKNGFPGGSACNPRDLGSITGLGRSPGEGNGNPLQHSCLENPMDRGAWLATVHRVPKSWTRMRDYSSVRFSHSFVSDSL